MDVSGNHKQAEQRERIRWIVSILIPLLCALLSFCVIAKYTSSPTMKINAHAIQSLDDKKTTALELTAAATAASAAITLIPGDAGTPIADKLADLSYQKTFNLNSDVDMQMYTGNVATHNSYARFRIF